MDKQLVVEDVCVNFGGVQALSQISFTLAPGEIVGLIGPNGAGKTTVFNVITGVYRYTSGQVSLNGRLLKNLRPHAILGLGIARTFQNIRLFPNMSALENVMIGQHARTRAGVAAAVLRTPGQRREEKRIQDKALAELAFLNMETEAGQLAKNMAYGLQRRLEIARALASDPRVLLLDEPAAGLNPAESKELTELIRRIAERNITVLLVEHDMKVVMGLCHRLVVLDHGEKIAEGPPEDIRRNKAVIEAYLGQEHL
jgi:branched-chain amino acid transport system ATP-binding protein